MLGFLYARFAGFLPVGAANRDYFLTLGVPERRLHFSPHSVDASRFALSDPAHLAAATALRSTFGLAPHDRVVLFAGKLIPAKQPFPLLEAFLTLRPRDTVLIFVGDGEEKPGLVARAAASVPK